MDMKMKLSKTFLSLLLLCMLSLSFTGCSKEQADDNSSSGKSDPIYIGTSFPMSGNIASEGKQIVNAIQLAADQVNASGGINGRNVSLKTEDDEGDATTAATIANKFSDDSSVLGVIMSYNSSCALSQAPIFNDAGLVSISPTSENPGLTGISDYFYRTCCSNTYSAVIAADLCQKLGLEKVAIMYQNDDYGQGIYDVFEKACKERGITISSEQSYVQAETVDFSTQLTAISHTDAQGIFIAGYTTEAGLICSQKATYNCDDLTIVGITSVYADEIFDYENTDGIYSLSGFSLSSKDEKVVRFISDYKEAYGGTPSAWSAYAYDAAMVMLESMKTCGDDLNRETLKDAIKTSSYQGVTGDNTFINGDVEKDFNFYVTKNGKWVDYIPE